MRLISVCCLAYSVSAIAAPPPPARAPAGLDPARGVAPLVAAIAPAVLEIEVEGAALRSASFEGPPEFQEFFRRFLGDLERPRQLRGEGSGFIIDPTGLVLTNHHVVEDARTIQARLANGTLVEAKLVASDAGSDIALLQLAGNASWPWLELGDSSTLQVGDPVVAVGNPLGLGITVTTGILSGKGRNLGDNPYHEFLQTDAAINQGNSGGPLLTLDGKVIGMNTAIIQYANTVGFAVPSSQIKRVVEDLRQSGRVQRGFLGVEHQDVDTDLASALRLPVNRGAIVTGVAAASPADKAGIQVGDAILKVGDEDVVDGAGLVRAVGRRRPGEVVPVEVWRDGKRRVVSPALGSRPTEGEPSDSPQPPSPAQTPSPTLGVKVQPTEAGLLVLRVDADGPAAGKLFAGDVIVSVNRAAVKTSGDLDQAVRASAGDLFLEIQRDDTRRFVALSVTRSR